MSTVDARSVSPGYRFYVLAVLILVYMLNFLDRQIIGILAVPLKAEFGLSDTQFGLLGGIAFASVYTTLAIPLAWLADRFSRVWIMSVALAVWSGFTALCGVSGSFGQLFLARMGVGVGEAGGSPPAYSLIADYFPKAQRARALAVYSFGIPMGTAAGTLVGGVLAAQYGWRTAFIVVGLLGVAVAPLLRLTVRDPARGGLDVVAPDAAPVPQPVPQPAPAPVPASGRKGLRQLVLLMAVCALVAGLSGLALGLSGVLLAGACAAGAGMGLFVQSMIAGRDVAAAVSRKPSFWLLSLGAAASSVCGYGVAGWLPTFFMRSFDLTLLQTSWYYSGIALVGGVAGIWMGGVLADRLGKASRAAYPLIPAVAFLISAPCFVLAMNSAWLIEKIVPGGGGPALSLAVAFVIFLIPTGLNLSWAGPILAAVQHLVAPSMRTMASALFLLINNLLGIAVGFYYFGWMSDLLAPRFGDESLRWAIYTGMGFYALASLLLIGASRTLKKDWVD